MIDEKKLLKHLSDWWLSETPSGDGTVLVISGELQKTPMMKIIEDFMKTVEQQPKVGEWIPCSERLPKNIKTVLITIKELEQPILGWYGDKFGWRIVTPEFVNIKDYTVIAWMPLPPAYKEGEDGDN